MSNKKDFPRRANWDKMTDAEKAISMSIDDVEKMGADEKLTDAVILLQQAQDKVSDFVDQKH